MKINPAGCLMALSASVADWHRVAAEHAAARQALLAERSQIIAAGKGDLGLGQRQLEAMMPLSSLTAEPPQQMEIPAPPSEGG